MTEHPRTPLISQKNSAIPSGKRLHNYGKSPFSMGKSTLSMAIFNSLLYVYQRVICERLPNHPGLDTQNALSGWWLTYPSEKSWSESQLGWWLFPTEWKAIKFHGSKPPTSIYNKCVRHSFLPIAIIFWLEMSHQMKIIPPIPAISLHEPRCEIGIV